jgi:hypothetical protein
MADDDATVFCKWERQRYPATEFTMQAGSRVHQGSSPLHTATGRLVDDGDFPPLEDSPVDLGPA